MAAMAIGNATCHLEYIQIYMTTNTKVIALSWYHGIKKLFQNA